MEFQLLDVVQHILNIAVLYILVRVLLYAPVRAFMLRRGEAEEKKRKEIDSALAEADALVKENERRLEDAQNRTKQLIDAKIAYADEVANETVRRAEREAREIIQKADAEIEEERKKAESDLVEQTAEMAVDLARQILMREISVEDNRKLIESYFRKVVS